jgi:hypothetical protein
VDTSCGYERETDQDAAEVALAALFELERATPLPAAEFAEFETPVFDSPEFAASEFEVPEFEVPATVAEFAAATATPATPTAPIRATLSVVALTALKLRFRRGMVE